MQPALQPSRPPTNGESGQEPENLALLYQGLLTGIARLQAGRQHITDGESFRRRTKAALQEVERDAVAAGYDREDVRDTHFAVVAFLDSVILHSNDPARAEWERKPLQQDLFGQADAGVVFFEKLDHFRSRRDSERLADILEVYLLCLLLGFEGRYSGGLRGELEGIAENVRRRIDDIRGSTRPLSPSGGLPAEMERVEAAPPNNSKPLRTMALGAVIFSVVLFLLGTLNLMLMSDEVRGVLGQR